LRALAPRCRFSGYDAGALLGVGLRGCRRGRHPAGEWFEPCDEITQLSAIETAAVGSRQRVGYRFGVSNGEGDFVVEQQAYFEPDGDQIGWFCVMCAGFQTTS